MTKHKSRCEAEMRYKLTKINFVAQCFKFEMVTEFPNMNFGAKLRCTKNEQNKPRCAILRIRCGDKMTDMNRGAKLRCAKNDKTLTSVRNVSS